MIWVQCPGSGRPAMKSEQDGGRPMCPVCTKYVIVRIGESVPVHNSVVIESTSINYPR